MAEVLPHPDLADEQAHVDRAYACLAAMRARAERAADAQARYGAHGEVDALAAEAHLRHRVRDLVVDVPGLAFGRIDPDDASGERHHVGRRHVEDADGSVVVVDWRAPVATAFYRATPADPQGLLLRRRFATEGTRVEALFDERFDDPDSIDAAHGGVPDPLLAELERARTGAMRDIVATIQGEQDVVIRAPLERCLVVQGGPGTGKTAVGLPPRRLPAPTSIARPSTRPASSSSGPTRRSCATSPRCSRRWARPACARPPWPVSWGGASAPTSTPSAWRCWATPAWRRWRPGPSPRRCARRPTTSAARRCGPSSCASSASPSRPGGARSPSSPPTSWPASSTRCGRR